MSWMEKLYQTYDAAILLGLPVVEGKQPLMPICHTLQNAHINIVIDGGGNFKRASVLGKTQIILPATEDSASRGNIDAPHGLADKLQYIAKDYESHGGKKKPYFESYSKQLQAWCASDHAHDKVKAVYQYIKKGTVIADLVAHKILFVNADNQLLMQWNSDDGETPKLFKVLPKEKGKLDQGSALVCWTVQQDSDPNSDTWKDTSIQASWIAYNSSDSSDTGLCYITGHSQILSTKHPAKIRHSGDKAKLISSNDKSGYTYRGRFLEDAQACGIGFDVSQKAHNALSWLIQHQGFRNGDQAYISWAVSGKSIPEPLTDTWSLLAASDDFNLDIVEETDTPTPEKPLDQSTDLGQSYAGQLRNYMSGYAAKLSPNEQIIIMGIDSSTPGRMGVIYYRELLRDDFFQRLESWHRDFAWYQRHTQKIPNDTGKKPKTNVIFPISSPLPKDIATVAYGDNVTDSLKKKVIERLIPCIIDGQSFPLDLLNNCLHKAINRVGYANDAQWLWEKNLGITCALYRGFRAQHPDEKNQRRTFEMALEEDYYSRDYLYGRLLAVAERIEEDALNITGEKRPTNAARLMQRFADQPAKTWLIIYKALDPYMQRLQVSPTGFLYNRKKELGSILEIFTLDDYNNNTPLSGEFLLGYYCQRQKRYTKAATTDEPTNKTPQTGDAE